MSEQYQLNQVVKEVFGISLASYQESVLYDCLNHDRVVVVQSRQSGKSTTIAVFVALEAMRNKGGHIIIVAPADRQSKELFLKISSFLLNSPFKSQIQSVTQRELIINDCRIGAYPVGNEGITIRGMSAQVLVMEECAWIKDSIANQVLLPMVAATGGKVVKIGTPFGTGNHFYRSFQEDEKYVSHRYTWEHALSAGLITQDFIDEQKRQCTDLEFKTEYGAEFVADQDTFFSHELIMNCVETYQLLSELDLCPSRFSYVLGVDLARMGQDSSAFVVIQEAKKQGGVHKVVFVKEIAKNTMDEAITYIEFLHAKIGFRKIVCDSIGVGAGVVDVLARKYNTQTRVNQSSYSSSYVDNDIVVGLKFTLQNKEDVFSYLKLLMQQGKLKIPNHKKLIYQLKDFRYEVSGSSGRLKLHHSKRGHDDLVDALACAAHALRERKTVVALLDRLKEEAGIEY